LLDRGELRLVLLHPRPSAATAKPRSPKAQN
jgi:hypothetical protein